MHGKFHMRITRVKKTMLLHLQSGFISATHTSSSLQISSNMYQPDNLQKAQGAITPGVSWSVALLHICQGVQVRTDLQ